MENAEFGEVQKTVNTWAYTNAHDDYLYGSPQSYWSKALHASIITKEEYETATLRYGDLWTYRGD